MLKSCIIVGGGIAGPATALALSKIGIDCSIYEMRESPSSIGGAINLTPYALRILDGLGVVTSGCVVTSVEFWSLGGAGKLGEMPFRGTDGHALRMLRKDLQNSLITATEQVGIQTHYGSKLESIEKRGPGAEVTAIFSNGKSVQADFIVGCDGIHSAVRSVYVEPKRKPIYTGSAGTYSIVDLESIESPIHFQDTALNMSRYGTVLTSFIDRERTQIYVAAVMQSDLQGTEIRKAQGSAQTAFFDEIHRRYQESSISCITEMVNQLKDLFIYPVFKLGPLGKWFKEDAVLLGDAAHAMPPQGEAAGLALEDAVLLARVFQECPNKSIPEVFGVYERTRRPRINTTYKAANMRWEGVKDKGWLKQKLFEWVFWAFLWAKGEGHQQSMAYDVRTEVLRT